MIEEEDERRCSEPLSSVIFDHAIFNLSTANLSGNVWAEYLFTVGTDRGETTTIEFDFSDTLDYNGVQSISVWFYNNPSWRISVDTIRIFTATGLDVIRELNAAFQVSAVTSNDTLVQACLEVSIPEESRAISLEFRRSGCILMRCNLWTQR